MGTSIPLPLTYPDAVWLDDLDAAGSETTSDLQTLAQDTYHWLLTRPGGNLDNTDRGIGLASLLNSSSIDLLAAASIVDADLKKDPWIQASQTTITLDPGSTPQEPIYTISIAIQPTGAVMPQRLGFTFAPQTGLVASHP
jgi:hypothetical protein